MSKKLLQYYQSKMQTGGKVLPLYAEGDPVPSRYAPIPRASDIRRAPLTPVKQTAAEARVAQAFNPGTIRPAQPQNRMAKALAIAANPATAASYVVKGQRIPDNFDRAETNNYEMATSVVNPFAYLKQAVDMKRDLEEGNYGSAALNAMGILPTRLPNFGRITSSNLDGFLGKQLNNFNKDLLEFRGKNNEGVFLMRDRDDIVVKLEDAQRTAHFTDTPEFLNVNMADKMRDIPDNLPISKTLYQLDDVRMKGSNTPLRASFMSRVKGIPGGKMAPSDFVKIPERAYADMYNNIKLLRNNDLAYDYFGNNYLYDPNTKQFGLFDIGLQPKQRGYWADDVYGASSKQLFGVETSAGNIKKAMRDKFSGDFQYTMEPEYDSFYRGENNLTLDDLQRITAEGSRRVSQRVYDALKNLDPYDEGGAIDPVYSDNTSVRKPMVRMSPAEMNMQRLANYAKQFAKRQQPVVQQRSSTPDQVRKDAYNWRRAEELLNKGLGYADVMTDAMQLGNFIPFPVAQAIGKVGNMLGSGVDSFQMGMDTRKGDYGRAAINAASVALPQVIQDPNILGGYRRPAKYNFGNRSFYLPVDRRYGRMTQKQLMGNRALLGALGAETMYDSFEDGGPIVGGRQKNSVLKLDRRGMQSPADNTRQVISPKTLGLYENYAYASDQFNKAKSFHSRWMDSPMYKKMIGTSDPVNAQRITDLRKSNLQSATFRYVPEQPKDEPDTGGYSNRKTGRITFLPLGVGVRGMGTHEMSHSIDRPDASSGVLSALKNLFTGDYSDPSRAIPSSDIYRIHNISSQNYKKNPDMSQEDSEWFDYVTNPTETRARLNDIRQQALQYGLYDPFTEKVTPEIYNNKLKKFKFEQGKHRGFDALRQLRGVYTDDQIIYLLNSVSKNESKIGLDQAKDGGQHGGLDRWFAEKWVDVKSGKPCGRQEGENRAYPACRPSRRVNSGTPKTSSEMSPAEKARFKREKTSSKRISYNHKRG